MPPCIVHVAHALYVCSHIQPTPITPYTIVTVMCYIVWFQNGFVPWGVTGNSEGESGLKGQKCLRKYEAKLQVGKGRVIKAIPYIESIFLGNPF